MSRFDKKLAAGEGVVGTFSHLGGPAVAECLSLYRAGLCHHRYGTWPLP